MDQVIRDVPQSLEVGQVKSLLVEAPVYVKAESLCFWDKVNALLVRELSEQMV